MSNPWAFGWTQLLTIIGFLITLGIAIGGFRTFNRWKREKLEEKKIEIAFEALSIAYETKFVFEEIRSPMSYGYEWKDMPRIEGESDNDWNHRGSFYAILKRIEHNKDFFERVWRLQPRFMAVFGPDTEEIFLRLHQARRFIEVSAQMLARRQNENVGEWNENRERQRNQMEADIWSGMDEVYPGTDRVKTRLTDFKNRIETVSRPIIDRGFKRVSS